MAVTNLKFEAQKDPEVFSVINRIAALEHRKTVHDIARRLILDCGSARIKELEQKQLDNQSASAG